MAVTAKSNSISKLKTTKRPLHEMSDSRAPGEDGLPMLIRDDGNDGQSLEIKNVSPLWRLLRKLRWLLLVPPIVATAGVVGLYFQPPGLKMLMSVLQLEPGGGTSSPIAVPVTPRPDPANLPASDPAEMPPVIGLGKLVPRGDIHTIATPFGAADARIAKLHVEEGEQVEAGRLIASLDNESTVFAAIDNARATVEARRATLNQVRSSVFASQQETRALLQRAESALANAQQELDRARSLVDRGYTTVSTLDQKISVRDQAQGEVDRLKATLARFAASTLEEQADVMVAARNVDAALSELARARADLAKTQVLAPISGTVINIHVQPGERPGNAGIADIGDIAHMTAEVEIYQTHIGSVTIGAAVELTAEALPQPLAGVVSKIGLEVGTQTLVDPSPAANTDARVVKVTVTLDPDSSRAASRFTNLQVLARIQVPQE